MYRLSAFIGIVLSCCLLFGVSASAQRNPEPYDESKRKKSSAKADSTTKKNSTAKKDSTAKKQDKKKEDKKKDDKKKDEAKAKENREKDAAKKSKKSTNKTKSSGKANASKDAKSSDTKVKTDSKVSTSQTTNQKVAAETPKTKTSATSSSGPIRRAMFTKNVIDREPIDDIQTLTTDIEKIYFFTEIVGMDGKLVRHQWIYKDSVYADVPIQVGGPRWRASTSKKFLRGWTGEWKVAVVGEDGKTLVEDSFAYVAATQ